jgi:uncharacterized YccA/Bax inhibitor family protein
MFGLVVLFAFIGWNVITAAPGLMFPIFIVAIVLGFANALKKSVSPVLMMVFAVAEGLMLGGISNFYNSIAVSNGWDSGIVIQAVVATMTTFGVMLTLYLTGIIKVTKRFTQVLMVAAVSYIVLALASFVAAIFGVGGGWGFYGVGGLGIIICLAGVGIAAFFLVLDFEAIKQGVAMGLPERESWRMSFGLLVTLVWIYLEFLRLFAILSGHLERRRRQVRDHVRIGGAVRLHRLERDHRGTRVDVPDLHRCDRARVRQCAEEERIPCADDGFRRR